MAEKLIVHFEELPVLPHHIDYLTYCKQCKTYNLGNKACVKCGKAEEVALDEIAKHVVLKSFVLRELITIGIYMILGCLAQEDMEFVLATLFTGVCLGVNLLIYKKYRNELILRELRQHIHDNIKQIEADLGKQMRIATCDVEAGNVALAYDRFRYLSKLIDNDEIRTYKLVCLRNFRLRRDMPLETKEILQQEYNTYLVDYIYEVSKIKKELIDDATLGYIIQFKEEVLRKYKGAKIMGSILSGALKSKFLLNKYASEMLGYLKYFSKDRLLRLCKMSGGIKDVAIRNQLLQEVKGLVERDEQFKDYF